MKKTFLLPSLLGMLLSSCGGNSSASPSATPLPSMAEEDFNAIAEQLDIIDADEIRGNIYLPEEIDGAKISWQSDHPDVVSASYVGEQAPGVVNRGQGDIVVKLTATAEKDGLYGVYTQEVTVMGLERQLDDDDFEGYLFGHFIGEGNANQEQIYFALSEGGLSFRDMNGGQPVLKSDIGEKGVRDPYICRSPEGDRFFLIATDLSIFHRGGWKINAQGYYDPSTTGSHNLVLWKSTDLVEWGEPELLPLAPENAGMAWAPEMIYDDVSGQYIIFFASSIMNPETLYKDKPNAIYYVATRDFVHFSDTQIFIDNQDDPDGKPREIIDTTVIKVGDYYYSASKDGDNSEANGGIRIMKTENLLDASSWEKVLDLDELGLNLSGQSLRKLDNSTLEGPEFFPYNKADWADPEVPEFGLMADQYAAGAGYLPLSTTDIEDYDNTYSSWKVLSKSDYSFDRLKKRHGTILRITREEIDRLNEVFSA